MPQQPQKDGLDTVIDFFFGALFGICSVIGVIFYCGDMTRMDGKTWLVLFFAASLVCGSLAALARAQFWSKYESYKVIPSLEDGVSKGSGWILGSLLILGVASLGLLFI